MTTTMILGYPEKVATPKVEQVKAQDHQKELARLRGRIGALTRKNNILRRQIEDGVSTTDR